MINKILNIFITMFIVGCTSSHSETKNLEEKQNYSSGFVAKENNRIVKTLGQYQDRHSLYSTFKIALALMDFDAGILKTPNDPKWVFKQEYEDNFGSWYKPGLASKFKWVGEHTPSTFMKNSVVWFSHQITKRLGKIQFAAYVQKFKYGNIDVSGNPGKDDGFLNSWLRSSLEISALEQVDFLEKLHKGKLDVSENAIKYTKAIMNRNEEWNSWKVYGKTGGGESSGWFIGWIEKANRRIVFAQYVDSRDKNLDLSDIPPRKSITLTAKDIAKRELGFLIK